MSHEVRISHNDLIDMLEDNVGGVYENIKGGDKVTRVGITHSAIVFTIGDDDEEN